MGAHISAGKLTLDALFEERSSLNANIVATIQQDAEEWGVQCKRYEISIRPLPPAHPRWPCQSVAAGMGHGHCC
jgi:hypothetical protein